jgi:hypothetical protein
VQALDAQRRRARNDRARANELWQRCDGNDDDSDDNEDDEDDNAPGASTSPN